MAKTTKYAGTQTEKNLQAAFAGESQARSKYTFFASVAKKQGYEQIAALFLKTPPVWRRPGSPCGPGCTVRRWPTAAAERSRPERSG